MARDKPHDSLFKFAFSDPATATAHFQTLLPPALAAELDWSTLALQPGSYIDESFEDLHSDLLFLVRTNGGSPVGLYLLFEHQSSSDFLMAHRLYGYLARIWDRWLSAQGAPPPRHLPSIVPVVLYHGRSRWTAPLQFGDLLQGSASLRAATAGLTPDFRYLLQDLSALDDDELTGSAMGRMVQLLFKRAWEGNLWEHLARWIETVVEILDERAEGLRAVEALVRYIVHVNNSAPSPEVREILRNRLGSEGEDNLMTYAEQLREEGRREAREELNQASLNRSRARFSLLLQQRFSEIGVDELQRVMEADEDQLDRWFTRLLSASSPDEVFAD